MVEPVTTSFSPVVTSCITVAQCQSLKLASEIPESIHISPDLYAFTCVCMYFLLSNWKHAPCLTQTLCSTLRWEMKPGPSQARALPHPLVIHRVTRSPCCLLGSTCPAVMVLKAPRDLQHIGSFKLNFSKSPLLCLLVELSLNPNSTVIH